MALSMTKAEALAMLASGDLDVQEYLQWEQEDKAEGLKIQTGRKGTLSLYGIRRFPVSFYPSEWEQILAAADRIKAHIVANVPTYHAAGEYTDDSGTKIKSGAVVVRLSTGKNDKSYLILDNEDADKWLKEQTDKAKAAKGVVRGEVNAQAKEAA